MAVHPLAVVDAKAEVHEEATIGPFCVVGAGARIEAGAELRNHATVYGKSVIGSGTIIFPGAVIASDPQDLKYRGEDSEVIIGKNCRIHECATVSKGTASGGMQTVIGDRCLIMAYAHVAHDCRLDESIVVGNNSQLAGHVKIGRRVVISGMVGVHHFVTVGELAFISGMSGVKADVPPYTMADGHPSTVRGINQVGLRRDRWSETDIDQVRAAFKAIFRSKEGSIVDGIEEVRSWPSAHQEGPVKRLCEWLELHVVHGIKGRLQETERKTRA